MTLVQTKRQEAHAALLQAKEFAGKITGEPDKAAEWTQKFNLAHADAMAKIAEAQRLEGVERQAQEIETALAGFERVPGTPPGARRSSDAADLVEKMKAAHKASFRTYVKHGEAAAIEVLTRGGVTAQSVGYILRGVSSGVENAAPGPIEQHALLQSQGDLGGFLVPDDFRALVIKDLAGFTVIRKLARVESTSRSALVLPTIQSASTDADIYSTGYTGAWKAEGYVQDGNAPPVQNQPKFGQARIPVHTWAPNAVELTQELLEDSAANLDGIISEAIAETKGLDEDAAFINGTGVSRPLGILQTAGVTAINTGHATTLLYDGLIDLFVNLPAQYRQNATFLMSSLTYGAVLKLKDGQNYPIITPNTLPGTLWGRPLAFSEFMPDVGTGGAKVIAFGDFRYFIIADRQELRIMRLLERYAPNVGILPNARTGGQIVRTAAFRLQNTSV